MSKRSEVREVSASRPRVAQERPQWCVREVSVSALDVSRTRLFTLIGDVP